MKFILYCRKSTDTDDKQSLSLGSQEKELKELAVKEGYEIVETLFESKSAKAPGRPVFNEMIKKIKAGKADAILCWKIDRITRNPIDSGQLQWLLQNSIIKLIRTFEKSYLPTDNAILMGVESSQSSQFIRDLSENVKRGNRAKLEKGEDVTGDDIKIVTEKEYSDDKYQPKADEIMKAWEVESADFLQNLKN